MSGDRSPGAPAATDLRGKVAVVTGGGKGVGAAISRELAARGAYVVVNHFHSSGPAEDTVAAIRRAGGLARAVRASVAKREQVEALFASVADEHGGLDVLVNNAARGVFARYDDLTDVEWRRALDTNLHGARWCALAAAPLMATRGGGAIVNVSSIGAGLAMDNYLLVGVCKAALEAMTRYLAADLGPQGIRVNTASAGLLDNPTAALFPGAAELRDTCPPRHPRPGPCSRPSRCPGRAPRPPPRTGPSPSSAWGSSRPGRTGRTRSGGGWWRACRSSANREGGSGSTTSGRTGTRRTVRTAGSPATSGRCRPTARTS